MTSFDDAHAQVSPYAHHIRLVLFCEDDLAEFDRCCDVTNVRRPACPASPTEAARRCFFSVMKLREVQCWIASVDWPVAFQIETILHNGLATTEDVLEDLMGPIIRVYEEDRAWCAALLRRVVESLQSPTRPPNESVLQCFTRVEQEKDNLILNSMPPGMFSCCHVTFTPTRMLLEGP
jgi:RNA-dependent RNA polymerase